MQIDLTPLKLDPEGMLQFCRKRVVQQEKYIAQLIQENRIWLDQERYIQKVTTAKEIKEAFSQKITELLSNDPLLYTWAILNSPLGCLVP